MDICDVINIDMSFYLFHNEIHRSHSSVPDIETYSAYELEYISTMIDSTSIKNIRTNTHLLLMVHNITTDQEMNKPRVELEPLWNRLLRRPSATMMQQETEPTKQLIFSLLTSSISSMLVL